jgi:hypothetical protein
VEILLAGARELLDVEGVSHVMVTPFMAAVPAGMSQTPVLSL